MEKRQEAYGSISTIILMITGLTLSNLNSKQVSKIMVIMQELRMQK